MGHCSGRERRVRDVVHGARCGGGRYEAAGAGHMDGAECCGI